MPVLATDSALLAASPHFRWIAGMLDTYARRILSVDADGSVKTSDLVAGRSCGESYNEHEECTVADLWPPDLSDPATLSLLPTIAREAWGDPHLSARWLGDQWEAVILGRFRSFTGPTESECWYAAILAAPAKEVIGG